GAEDALVDRVVAVALDIADAALLQMHVDAAAAGAHIAGGPPDLVRDAWRGLHLRHGHFPASLMTRDSRAIPRVSSSGVTGTSASLAIRSGADLRVTLSTTAREGDGVKPPMAAIGLPGHSSAFPSPNAASPASSSTAKRRNSCGSVPKKCRPPSQDRKSVV